MKKTQKPQKKLKLNQETVRLISANHLGQIAAGATTGQRTFCGCDSVNPRLC